MPLVRLTYISENVIPHGERNLLHELQSIGSASRRNNHARNITGALAFDSQWFLQVLEGERKVVWTVLEAIRLDHRHEDVTILEAVDTEQRMFGQWSMAVVRFDPSTEREFARFVRNGLFRAEDMKAADVVSLLSALTKRHAMPTSIAVPVEVS